MTLVDDLIQALPDLRAIPGQLGLNQYSLKACTRVWSGGAIASGTPTTTEVPILEGGGQNPESKFLSEKELALGGYQDVAIKFWITPQSTTGTGVAVATLRPASPAAETEFWLEVTGPQFPSGARFSLEVLNTSDPFQHEVTLQRIADS